MKFFIPHAKNDAEAERVIVATSEFVKLPIPNPRIYAITYEHNRIKMKGIVGEKPNSYYQVTSPIICILGDEHLYGICTLYRGVIQGVPILVGGDKIISIEYFE